MTIKILHESGNDVTIATRSPPVIRIVKDMNCANAVRSYRISPEDVAIQIRLKNRYVKATLTLEEARFLAKQIEAAAGGGS